MANKINLKFPLRKDPEGGFQSNDLTIGAATADLRVLLLTNHGERPANYFYGANLRKIIFEQGNDVRQRISDAISDAVERWLPFISIIEIIVDDQSSKSSLGLNQVHVEIHFLVGQIEGTLQQKLSA